MPTELRIPRANTGEVLAVLIHADGHSANSGLVVKREFLAWGDVVWLTKRNVRFPSGPILHMRVEWPELCPRARDEFARRNNNLHMRLSVAPIGLGGIEFRNPVALGKKQRPIRREAKTMRHDEFEREGESLDRCHLFPRGRSTKTLSSAVPTKMALPSRPTARPGAWRESVEADRKTVRQANAL